MINFFVRVSGHWALGSEVWPAGRGTGKPWLKNNIFSNTGQKVGLLFFQEK